jgi:predicted MFS family arabinose efflux permease
MSPAVAAVAVTVVGLLPVYLLGGLAVQVRADLDIGRTGLGQLVAAFFGGAAVGSLLGGRAADRLGAGHVMRGAAAAGAVGPAGRRDGPHRAGARGRAGRGRPRQRGGSTGLQRPHRPSRRRAPARHGLRRQAGGHPAGVLVGGLAVPVFGVTVGWRWAYVAAGAVAVVVPLLVQTRAVPVGPDLRGTQGRSATALRAAQAAGPYRLAPLLVLAVGTTLGAAVGNCFAAFFVETAVEAGQAPGTAGLLAAGGSALGVIARLGLGVLADRRDGRWFLVVAGMMLAGVPAGALLASGAAAGLVPAVILAYGLGWAWAGLVNHAVTLLHPHAPGRATGVTQSGVALGAVRGTAGVWQAG